MILLLFLWESEGVKIMSLHQEEYNYRNKVFYFVGVACLTVLYAVTMTTLGFTGIKIPPKAVSKISLLKIYNYNLYYIYS